MTKSWGILRIKKVLWSNVLELKDCDRQICKDHSKNCDPSYFLNIYGMVDSNVCVISTNLKCMLCETAQWTIIIVENV